MDFDTMIDRRGTRSMKWDAMESRYGVSSDDGIAMWVADMDFKPPQCVSDAVARMQQQGVYGYHGDDSGYRAAIAWWMKTRHDWQIQPDWIFSTHGLVNGTAMCIDAFTQPGDGIVLFTPVYHAFARVITAAGRRVVECPMINDNGRYSLDLEAYAAQMTGNETMLVFCSPHNPGGRVWTRDELEAVADFARRHDLVLVSDEIHHDLVFPGQTHIPMSKIDWIEDRLVMMTAASKTFNIAGSHIGNVIIANPAMRARFSGRMQAMGLSPNSFGLEMVAAAYSPEGAEWVDALVAYLDENRKILDAGLNAIPGVVSMPLESTYLSWVDFDGTGMSAEEIQRRVQGDAKIAANHGTTFGTGGEHFLRFNVGTQRARIVEAVERMQKAFADLQ